MFTSAVNRSKFSPLKLGLLIPLLLLLLSITLPSQANTSAVIFLVERSNDVSDANPGDGICDANLGVAGDQCSLRAAIEEANARAGADIIRFDDTVRTITPMSAYPTITEQVTINGVANNSGSCPTATDPANLLVTIDGSNTSDNAAFMLGTGAANSLIRGLAIVNFTTGNVGVAINTSADNTSIQCNHIGIEADGETAGPNTYGVSVHAIGVLIGGPDVDDRNVISGNNVWGISNSTFADDVEIYNNYIGTNADGTSGVPNLIAVNTIPGVSATVGALGQGNLIAYNTQDALVTSANNVTARYNSMFANGGLALDGLDSGTDFDFIDSTGQIIIDFDNYAGGFPATIDVYGNDECDPVNGEGKDHFATFDVASATPEIDMWLNAGTLTSPFAAYTVTGPLGGTYEFSNCIPVQPAFRINFNLDLVDGNPGDGICDAWTGVAGEQCSPRAAFEEVNAQGLITPTVLQIAFALPFTPTLSTPLPALTAPITLDVSGDASVDCPTLMDSQSTVGVVFDGTNVGAGADGIVLQAGTAGSTIAGVSVINFAGNGIQIEDDNTTVRCSHIGVGANGVTAGSNQADGVSVPSGDNILIADSVIALNGVHGVEATTTGEVTVTNSFIGVNASYSLTGGNGVNGVGATSGTLNVTDSVIGGNGNHGVVSADRLNLLDNYIGTDVTSTANLGNGSSGVMLVNYTLYSLVSGNVIANNGDDGVTVVSTREDVDIVENNIFDNGDLGIDLNDDGVTLNDVVPDPDTGANTLQNFPVILGADGPSETISVTLESATNTTYRLDFYASDNCDPSGNGEGQRWLANFDLDTDASGMATGVFTSTGYVVNDWLTVTATGIRGTSEFSACFHAVENFVVNSTLDDADADPNDELCETASGVCTLRAAIQQVNALNEVRTIEFASDGMVFQPTSALPLLLKPVIIDGNPSGRAIEGPLTVIDGSLLASGDLLRLGAGSDGSSISGLQLVNGPASGLVIDSHANTVTGNAIGTDQFETDLGNAVDGITVHGDGNTIEDNVIYFNGDDGIAMSNGGRNNTLSGNSISDNGDLGIDLNDDGVSPNDAGDGDGGANRRQNYPLLATASVTEATGTLNSIANSNFQVELYGVESCDASGHGEGKYYLGSTTAMTDGSGNANFTITPDSSVCTAYAVATATRLASGDTSEFSACMMVSNPAPTAVTLQSNGTQQPATVVVALMLVVGSLLTAVLFKRKTNSNRWLLLLIPLLLLAGVQHLSADTKAVLLDTPPVTCDDLFIPDGTLDNNGSIEDESGLIIATVTDTLDSPVDIMLETIDTPVPAYDGLGTVVGPYYRIRPDADVRTPAGSPLVVAIPIPAGADGNDILVAVYDDAEDIRDTNGLTPWGIATTYLDSDDNLMIFPVMQLDTVGAVFTLAESPDFDPIVPSPRSAEPSQTINFEPRCLVPCLPSTVFAFAAEFEAAYNDFVVGQGFSDPVLPNFDIGLNGGQDDEWIPDFLTTNTYYGIYLKPAFLCNGYAGVFRTKWPQLEICSVTDPITQDVRETIRHELFHAIQEAYPASSAQFPDWDQEWVFEGTATVAEVSIGGVHRSFARDPRDIGEPLIQTYTNSTTNDSYEGQDFWFYLLDENGLSLNYFEQIFQGGAEAMDVNTTVGNLQDLYFEWVRNQVYEHHNDMEGLFTGAQCSNQGLLNHLANDWQDTYLVDGQTELTMTEVLQPLDSQLFIIDVTHTNATDVVVRVDEVGGGEASHYRVYSRALDSANCQSLDDGERTFPAVAAGDQLQVVVSNTDFFQTKQFKVTITVADNPEE